MAKRRTLKPELIDTGRNKMFARRDPPGRSRTWMMSADPFQRIAGEPPKLHQNRATAMSATGREGPRRRNSYPKPGRAAERP